MKRFIPIIPFSSNLEPVLYEPVDNDALKMDRQTRFPILAVIHAYAPKDEEWTLSPILTEGRDKWLKVFVEELETLCRDVGIAPPRLEPLSVSNDESVRSQMKTLVAILSLMKDGEDVYACITGGTKTLSNVLSMALRHISALHHSTSLECVVYGQFDRVSGERKIYDITALYRMEGLIELFERDPSAHPDLMLQLLLRNL